MLIEKLKQTKSYLERHKLLSVLLVSLPILFFCYLFYQRPNTILTGDWDYFNQLYEAFRKTVLQYHQFPWWNPWVGGGVPLYANPQFGLVSIQAPLVLLFGTLPGLKAAVVIYYLAGFWGMYLFTRALKVEKVRAILVSYIFTFAGFAVWHVAGGHLTFAMYYLAPLLFYFFVCRRQKRGWLYLVLYGSFFINAAPHYLVIQSLIALASISVYDYLVSPKKQTHQDIMQDLGVGLGVVTLSLHKLIYSFSYVGQYARDIDPQIMVRPRIMFYALFRPYYTGIPDQAALRLQFSWPEYSAYIGLLMLPIIVWVGYKTIRDWPKVDKRIVGCTVVAGFFAILALGPFRPWAPFTILQHLPVFKSMQVSSRWIGWIGFFLILAVALYKPKSRTENVAVNTLLFITVLELLFLHRLVFTFMNPGVAYKDTPASGSFELYDGYMLSDPARLLKGTRANLGEVRAYEPILGYSSNRPSNRGGVNTGKHFASVNARVVFWSPNKIVLERTGTGPIILNENPGSYWLVNGKRIFAGQKPAELTKDFIITDNSTIITCAIKPGIMDALKGITNN